MSDFFLRVMRTILASIKTKSPREGNIFYLLFFLCGLFVSLPSGSYALQSESKVTPQSTAAFVTMEDALAAPHTASSDKKVILHGGLSLMLAPQWHTYWRNPGDAGEAPEIQITAQILSKNGHGKRVGEAKEVASWETPVRFSEAGLTTYGYESQVLFPLNVPLTLPVHFSGKLKVTLTARWLSCAKLCIPEKAHFDLMVPVGKRTIIGPQKALFTRNAELSPKKAPFEARLEEGNHLRLDDQAQGKRQAAGNTREAYFYPYVPGILKGDKPQILQHNGADLILILTPDSMAQPMMDLAKSFQDTSLDGVIELIRNNGQRVYYELRVSGAPDKAVTPAVSPAVPEKHTSKEMALISGGFKLFLLAFFGGALLNLMPCVFPVLAMKAFSLAKLGSKDQKESVLSAIFYACGTVGAFLTLGIFVLALRSAGHFIGWGFQFQSPFFVALICWLLFGMALNLAGMFEIMPPEAAGKYHAAAGHFGDVVTGILAVIVASPCTAPFMGVALAGALAAPALLALGIFSALGLGLAFPYVLLACWPTLGRFLPKPGGWMDVFKHFLAFPLLAACIWLLWVISKQGGNDLVILVLIGGLLLSFGAWIFGISQKYALQSGGKFFRLRLWFARFAVCLCVGSVLALLWGVTPRHLEKKSSEESALEAFSLQKMAFHPDRLKRLREKGHAVFVDMGAAWCITCIVNERTTINTIAGEAALKEAGAVLMKGDWTNKAPEISDFLHQYHREGVPLYVWFPKNWPVNKPGILLPQVLTPSILKKALKEASEGF